MKSLLAGLGIAVRNKGIRQVQLAWGAGIAAEWAHFVALGVFAYQHGGTSAVGAAGLVRLTPAALLAPFAASLGDRFRPERFLRAMMLLGAGALIASAVAAFTADRQLVFGFAAVVGISSTLIRPALEALVPSLARTPDELIASNGVSSTVEGLGTLAGPLLAGVVVAVANVSVVFLCGGVALLAAAAALARFRVEGRLPVGAVGEAKSTARSIMTGFRTLADAPAARLLIVLAVAQAFVRGCLNVLVVVVVFRALHGSDAQVGYLTAAIGVGGIAGAFSGMMLKSRRLGVTFAIALVFWGLPITLMAPEPNFVGALVLLAIVGLANSVEDVAVVTLLQRLVPEETLTSVFGVMWGAAMGAVALGSIVAARVVDAAGPRNALVAVGMILPLLALATYRRLAKIDHAIAPAEEQELIERVPMFGPLSLAVKERLAAGLSSVSVAAGEVVINAGDVGDRFYIVGGGELEIDAGSRPAVAVANDYFGEIALLRDLPRTATVAATRDSRLFALNRATFVAAVTGHREAHSIGLQIVNARQTRVAPATVG
jgi:MFS family permease